MNMKRNLALIAIGVLAMGSAQALELVQKKVIYGMKVVAMAGKPKSTMFAVCLEDGTVKTLDAAGKKPGKTLIGHDMAAYGVAFSPDGRYLLTGDERAKIFLWDLKTGKKVREYPRDKGHKRGIQSLSFSDDGKMFLSVGADDVICIWKTAGGHPIKRIPGDPTNFFGAQFAPSGAIYTGTGVEGMRAYAPKTFNLARKVDHPGLEGANGFAINDRGTIGLTLGRNGFVGVFNLKTRNPITTLKGHNGIVMEADFAPDGLMAATGCTDGTVILWDVKKGKRLATLTDRTYMGSPVVITDVGNYLVTVDAFDRPEIHIIKKSGSE